MTHSPPNPQLPKWIFFLTDAVLLGAAWYIASRSPGPLSATAVFAITACVIAGAIIGTIPLVIHYEREKNETLDDRQRALEALARTVATSAEQISIAASGLHEIAELAQRNLRKAEQLPATLETKIAEFQSLLANAQADEREELKKELAQLRAAESDRLEAIADKVDHAAAELTKLEAAASKHLAAAQAALARAPEALAAATTAALAEIDSKLAARVAATPPPPPPAPPAAEVPEVEDANAKQIEPVVPSSSSPFDGHIVATEAPAAAESPAPVATESPAPAAPPAGEPKPVRKRASRKPKPVEPAAPALSLGIEEPAAPAAPGDEFSQSAPDEPAGTVAEVIEKVISSDGATRLLVTAYIGIGNRLFIRGDGPGLSWDKGVPLQFVSIGKWRWETADAAAPVKFKLFKNDESECTALGAQSLEPGHQQEITATF
jgi:hypothetical protein